MIRFSIMFFSANAETLGDDKYRLVVDAATFADQHAFEAVWVPERHFGLLGGLYPNPSVLQSALAVATDRIALRAGSVVSPLHNPIRIAEEWSMVDNLSAGRVGLSFASGWNPTDFALAPERYERRRDLLYEDLETVQRLWRGEAIEVTKGGGASTTVEIYPKPVQDELPVWITAARSPETFERAGTLGVNVLTHLLDQDVSGLAEKITIYRDALAAAGHDSRAGRVTTMLHTFVQPDEAVARDVARDPYCAFLKSNIPLLKGLAESRDQTVDLDALSPVEQDDFVRFLYQRFASARALIGSPESCLPLVASLQEIGVDEIACLLDFGPSNDDVMCGLPSLHQLATASALELRADAPSEAMPAPVVGVTKTVRDRCDRVLAPDAFARQLAAVGLESARQILPNIALNGAEALAEIEGSPVLHRRKPLDPALLETCAEAAQLVAPEIFEDRAPRLVSHIGALRDVVPDAAIRYLHVVRVEPGQFQVEIRFLDAAERVVGRLGSVRLRKLGRPPVALMAAAGDASSLYYEMAWEVCPAAADRTSVAATGRGWCIVGDRSPLGASLAEALRRTGRSCRLIEPGSLPEFWARQDADRLVGQLSEDAESPSHLVYLPTLDAPVDQATSISSLRQAQAIGPTAALLLMQALVERGGVKAPKLYLVTRAAHAVGEQKVPLSSIQSTLWGLGKTCAMEHPEIWGGLVDLDPKGDEQANTEALLEALLAADGEDQVAFRGGQRFVARLARRRTPHPAAPPVRHDGTYLVTGGLWGVGLEVSRWLLSNGAGALVLVGRSALPPEDTWDSLEPGTRAAELAGALRGLRSNGGDVRYEVLDVTDEPALVALLGQLSETEKPLRGVVHAASVWRDRNGETLIRPILQSDAAALELVFQPKVLGTWLLHQHTKELALDFFCLFSSAASLTGSAGQGSYAAASGFLDTLAHERARLGLPALAINLGPVSDAGFGATSEGLKVHTYWESNGLARVSPPQVLEALGALTQDGSPQAGFMRFDWQAIARFFPALYEAPWASRLVEAVAVTEQPSAFLGELRAAPASEQISLVIRQLQHRVAEVMGMEGPKLPPTHKKLFDMGVDSLMSIELKGRLQADFEAEIPITAVFNYPTIDALGGYVASQVLGLDQPDESEGGVVSAAEDVGAVDAALKHVHEISDEEVDRLLAAKTAELTHQSQH